MESLVNSSLPAFAQAKARYNLGFLSGLLLTSTHSFRHWDRKTTNTTLLDTC